MNEVIDLWPELSFEKIRSPKTVLKEQGEILAQKTNNVLKGEVTISKNTFKPHKLGELIANFYIVAPSLDNYKFHLVSIYYNTALSYPAYPVKSTNIKLLVNEILKNETELKNFLQEIFSSPDTMRIINSLYSQSLEETENV